MAAESVRFPDFLILGAMKAGTTSLYRDLDANPKVFTPLDKEPHNLACDDVLTSAGRRAYAALFAGASDDQICGEASTGYTKRPDITRAEERAREICGSKLRAVYLVRDPVARIVSHHFHRYALGAAPADINEAVRIDPIYINYSLYAMQVAPWLDAFGPDQIRIVLFEDYVADRRQTVEQISRFIGVESRPDLVKAGRVYNKSEGKPVQRGVWTTIYDNRVYRRIIRPLVPTFVKDFVFGVVMPRAPKRTDPPSLSTIDFIIDNVLEDSECLGKLIGASGSPWDFKVIRKSWCERKISSPSTPIADAPGVAVEAAAQRDANYVPTGALEESNRGNKR